MAVAVSSFEKCIFKYFRGSRFIKFWFRVFRPNYFGTSETRYKLEKNMCYLLLKIVKTTIYNFSV